MKFTDALILFCILSAGFGLAAFFSPVSSIQLAEKIFYLGLGVFSCWWNVTNLNQLLFGRLCRFFKAIPRCWADSKEVSK
jgi:hypothetical protein